MSSSHTVFFQPNLMAYICVWLYVNLFGEILELTHNFQPWVHIGPSGKRQAIFLERQEWSTAFKNLLAIPAIYRKRVGHLRKFIKNETGSEWWLPDLLCCLWPFLLVLLVPRFFQQGRGFHHLSDTFLHLKVKAIDVSILCLTMSKSTW